MKETDTVAATSDDWYIVFDIDAQNKVLSLWFYPVIAISGVHYEAKAIPSNPTNAKQTARRRSETRVNDEIFGISYSYGRWYRDGIPIDLQGKPDTVLNTNFTQYLASFIQNGFSIRLATPVPIKYDSEISNAHKKAKYEV